MASQVTKVPQVEIVDFADSFCEVNNGKNEYELNLAKFQYKTLWTYAINCMLGLWLIFSHFVFDYKSDALVASDTISGALIILFEVLSFSPKRLLIRWATPFVALWLLFAPLAFWSPTPAVYLLDTLIACLVITFSFLLPGTPGQGIIDKSGPDIPPGWSYNPSSWIRRWLGIALALLGFFIARYLASCQLGYIQDPWDPIFGTTNQVLHSSVSRSFPISDAGLGGVAYVLEVLAGFMGDRARWRTSPWVVTAFALLVLPLGATSILLVILQPVVVHAWCGLCLIAAAGLLASVPLAVHELIAMGQLLLMAKRQGKNLWHIFWMGAGIHDGGAADPDRMQYSIAQRWIASVQGVTVPWTLAIQIAIGAWLMARPDIISTNAMSANCDHLLGALAVTCAAIATAEVTRTIRFVNMPTGLAIIVATLIFARDVPVVLCSNLILGLILALTSLPKGDIVERYAGWNNLIK